MFHLPLVVCTYGVLCIVTSLHSILITSLHLLYLTIVGRPTFFVPSGEGFSLYLSLSLTHTHLFASSFLFYTFRRHPLCFFSAHSFG